MEWTNLLTEIFEVCVIPLLGVLSAYFVNYIRIKTNELKAQSDNATAQKYIGMLGNTVANCVLATQQTYVEALKKEGKFDAEAQKKALDLTYDAVLTIIGKDAQDYLNNACGDINVYIKNLIEAEISRTKAIK